MLVFIGFPPPPLVAKTQSRSEFQAFTDSPKITNDTTYHIYIIYHIY